MLTHVMARTDTIAKCGQAALVVHSKSKHVVVTAL